MGAANAKIAINSIFSPVGAPATAEKTLALFVLSICAAIFVLVAGLLAYSVVRYRARPGQDDSEPVQVYGSNPVELAWTVVPVLIVFVLTLVTTRTIYTVQAAPEPADAVKVRVIGHQWWWEFRYPELGIVSANELHIPLSEQTHPTPTFITLESADVDHSFWIPKLAGKTDLLPNRRNQMWLDPHEAGTYIGQCAEFCGTEHALMLMRVVVEPPDKWQLWVSAQQKAAASDPSAAAGRAVFEANACVNCHTVRGTGAKGKFGPDLTHLMSRETIAAGAAINSPDHLHIWIKEPDLIKPGALMPAMNLSDPELDKVVAYLTTLR